MDVKDTIARLELALMDPQDGNYLGVGLSANQIGDTDRVCIIRFGNIHLDLIGPYIVDHSDVKLGSSEGCLSLPNLSMVVMRWETIVVKADNFDDPFSVEDFDLSRIIQHEINHLDAILISDYKKIGRNDLCLCGSGKKYKKCCGA